MTFAIDGRLVVFEAPREIGLRLLEWLGLGRPEFGAIEVSLLMPLCRRRLWLEGRNDGPMRFVVARFARALENHPTAVVHFG